jgi:hypothetical protein
MSRANILDDGNPLSFKGLGGIRPIYQRLAALVMPN